MSGFVLVLVVLPAALISFVLEGRRKNNAHASQLPFTWGYFVGMSSLLLGAYLLILGIYSGVGAPQDVPAGGGFASTLGVALAVSGFYAMKRRKWAWVVTTILSCNPIWWIANTIYGHNRWHEFDQVQGRPVSAPATT